ncbi:hypothetical protein PIB30_041866 [Stylosanthes scabra]|uniref:Uncharacterized protein n=1 Tax=Stylosanthes scabra TaxID=79078 RepID=A0ABU6VD04_9FABA|nr:hypothetical protein [Stylosanthes scabra]
MSERNEEITKKSLEANLAAYADAPMVICVRIYKTWASRRSWKAEPMRTHLRHLSNSSPNLLLFDPEIERTLRRSRQVRRQIEFESNLHSQTKNLASENDSAYSFDPDFDNELSTSSDSDNPPWEMFQDSH